MIIRDEHGIVVQQPDMDGGDSASRTGLLALTFSLEDIVLLRYFIQQGKLVRHPFQVPFNSPTLTSRDQLVAFAAGFVHVDHNEEAKKMLIEYAKAGFINNDVLFPDVQLYLYQMANVQPPLLTKLLGNVFFKISMFWNTKIRPNKEMNQFICICAGRGPEVLHQLYLQHPDLEKNLKDYWGGWRQQPEIAEALIDYIKGEKNVKSRNIL